MYIHTIILKRGVMHTMNNDVENKEDKHDLSLPEFPI